MLTETQKQTAQAIVNIFETGRTEGDYGRVTLLRNDPGHLTYGRSQTTLASGNLYLLIRAYCDSPGALYASDLRQFLSRLASCDLTLDDDPQIQALLKSAGGDPVMHKVQDQFFDRFYWSPAVQSASELGIVTALGTGVVYDSCIHGSWGRVRDMNTARNGTPALHGEQKWIISYVEVRKDWLANNPNVLLRSCVYRMETFEELIGEAKWDLGLPLQIRGVTVDASALQDRTPVNVSAENESEKTLFLTDPPMRGGNVKAVQIALQKAGFNVTPDGLFDKDTDMAVRSLQNSKGLISDGIVGLATRSALSL